MRLTVYTYLYYVIITSKQMQELDLQITKKEQQIQRSLIKVNIWKKKSR